MPRGVGYGTGRATGGFFSALMMAKVRQELANQKSAEGLEEDDVNQEITSATEALASPLPDFLLKKPKKQIAKETFAKIDPESFVKSFLEPEKPKTKAQMEAEIFQENVVENPENLQLYLRKLLSIKEPEDPKRAKDVTGVGTLTAKLKSRVGKTESAQKAYDKASADIDETYPVTNREKLKENLGKRPLDYQIPEDISALADSVEAGRIDPTIAALLAGFDPASNIAPSDSVDIPEQYLGDFQQYQSYEEFIQALNQHLQETGGQARPDYLDAAKKHWRKQ